MEITSIIEEIPSIVLIKHMSGFLTLKDRISLSLTCPKTSSLNVFV